MSFEPCGSSLVGGRARGGPSARYTPTNYTAIKACEITACPNYRRIKNQNWYNCLIDSQYEHRSFDAECMNVYKNYYSEVEKANKIKKYKL